MLTMRLSLDHEKNPNWQAIDVPPPRVKSQDKKGVFAAGWSMMND